MYLPHKYLAKAINTKIKGSSIGYRTHGALPRVEVHSWDTTPEGEKTNIDWACTCIIEVISESTDVVESLTMIEKIRTNIDETLTVEHFYIWQVVWEILTEMEEVDDNHKHLFRQMQRVRFNLTTL